MSGWECRFLNPDGACCFLMTVMRDGVLLGCIAMRGVYVHHDVAAGRLGFAELGREFQ